MKTSNKLLITATLIIIGYLVAYDFSLKAEYVKGAYTSRFYTMKRIPLTNFNAIENNAANFTSLIIEQGPEYAIWVNKRLHNELSFTMQNKTVSINYKPEEGHLYLDEIIVTCPNLNSIITKPTLENGEQQGGGTTLVSGFKQDEMNVQSNNFTLISLKDNTINKLNAATGANGGHINVTTDNIIKHANFNILGRGRLVLLDPAIEKASYKFSDSAEISLSGKVLAMFPKQ
jgi:hypothetical protein